jgi:hypothetical protein
MPILFPCLPIHSLYRTGANMKSLSMSSALALLYASASVVTAAPAAPALSGFLQSCYGNNINTRPSDNPILSAHCRGPGGTYQATALGLNSCLENNFGTMGFAVDGGAFDTCTIDRLQYTPDTAELAVYCSPGTGRPANTFSRITLSKWAEKQIHGQFLTIPRQLHWQ